MYQERMYLFMNKNTVIVEPAFITTYLSAYAKCICRVHMQSSPAVLTYRPQERPLYIDIHVCVGLYIKHKNFEPLISNLS